jgi:septal ring-binding cell division protein DamX
VAVAATLAAGIAVGAAVQWWFSTSRPDTQVVPAQAAAMPAKPAPVEPKPAAQAAVPAEKPVAENPPEPPPPPPPPPSRLSDAQASRLAGYSAGRQPLLAERLAAARELLTRAPDESYAIELFNTDNVDPARMERFLLRARDLVRLEDLAVIPLAAGGGQYRLRVVYGEFPTREAALEAEKRLPPRYLNAFRTLPRSFAELRSQI